MVAPGVDYGPGVRAVDDPEAALPVDGLEPGSLRAGLAGVEAGGGAAEVAEDHVAVVRLAPLMGGSGRKKNK